MALTHMIRTLARCFVLLLAVLLFVGNAVSASAQSPTFGIRPKENIGYFQYTLAPGEHAQDVLVATNESDAPLVLVIRPVRGTTVGTGGIAFAKDGGGSAGWISIPDAGTVTIPAKSAVTFPFEVVVPAGTLPGEYVAGFLATPKDPPAKVPIAAAQADTKGKSSFKVQVVTQVGVAVMITVPSPDRCEVVASSVAQSSDNGRWKLALRLQNTGNVHYKGTGQVVARKAGSDDPMAQQSFKVGYFLAGDTIDYPLYLEPYPPAGDYTIEVSLLGECGAKTAFTQPVSISPAEVKQAAAAVASGQPSAADAQAQLIRSLGVLLAGLAGLVVAVVLLVFVLRRKSG
jgi:hypothetical protein